MKTDLFFSPGDKIITYTLYNVYHEDTTRDSYSLLMHLLLLFYIFISTARLVCVYVPVCLCIIYVYKPNNERVRKTYQGNRTNREVFYLFYTHNILDGWIYFSRGPIDPL